ncbi:TFIIH p62 subunit domain-containing protein [Coniochaeta ligniaria NRRL 30616]|uniref:TFIIH p62 subunit domain-containing protein n=1 Tax=Coniochaeta ligniaria NRRL 30616 TaxID=1408157 RepID=A0A1J7IJ91_9PEZI|nr:TFIIH p62 subunit domain-containing protein [Coniochaeta ligniaria NRRL 30616]
MAVPPGRAAYKKQDGILALSGDQKTVTWTPLPGNGPPVVSVAVSNITNLQQTPDNNPKVFLKIFEKSPSGDGDSVSYMFHFNSANPRPEANALKEALSQLLTANRISDPSLPKPTAPELPAVPANGSVQSASMAFASTVNSSTVSSRWFDDNVLRNDIELQQSLMKKDRALHQTYMDARATKPESISDAAFNSQFWSTRTNVLRAHAIDTNQKKGAYNVLSAVKPGRDANNQLKLTITLDQVELMFQQHPLLKRVYDENVPKLSDHEFWSRFFLSKLSKKLKGERIVGNENQDVIFDKYLNNVDEDTSNFTSRVTSQPVPHIIDLEANEENQGGFRSGNRKDVEMRPRTNVPIMRTLNSLSEKIMANIAPIDHDPTSASGMDEDTYHELYLRDLQGEAETERIVLNVKEQNKFFSNSGSGDQNQTDGLDTSQDAADVLFEVQADLETLDDDGAGGLDLHRGIGVDDESESDDDKPADKKDHVGSRAARKKAQSQILDGMRKKRAETYGLASDETRPMSIAADIAQRCYVTNATTTEFLRQFWSAFLSGNPDRAQELAYHVESLGRSKLRIEALAEEAEKAREIAIAEEKQKIVEKYKRTGKKVRNWNPDMVRGGKKDVMALFAPTVESLEHAQRLYRAALEAEGMRPSTEG